MRISSTQFRSSMSLAMEQGQGVMSDLLVKMSSGKRLARPSEDPIASIRLLRLEREEAALTQYRDNIGALRARLSSNESLLDGMKEDVLQARDLLVWAADGNNTAADLKAMSTSLESLRDSLFYTANNKDGEGRYLFSGTATDQATLLYDENAAPGNRYRFGGNEEKQQVIVGNGITQPANTTLAEMADLLNQLDAGIAMLQDPALDASDPAVGQAMRDCLAAADLGLNALTGKMAQIGGAQNTLAAMADNHEDVSLSNQENIRQLGSLDYASAYLEMDAWSMALQASQKSYAKISSLTLFDAF